MQAKIAVGVGSRFKDPVNTNTNKVKVNGSSLSEEIYLSLENGPFTPGASNEKSGADEIEFDGKQMRRDIGQ